MAAPRVRMTEFLRNSLMLDGFDPDYFAKYFAEWKALGAVGEFDDYYFGKDGEYSQPLRGGRRVLRHVHLPPESDADAIADWNTCYKRGSRKTSDTSLIYAYDPTNGYLLISIAREPTGHELATMATELSKDVMNHYADVAEEFIMDNTIAI